jgi:arginyl-tRNA--protein-N-Asp/Glu arginylyltransferase
MSNTFELSEIYRFKTPLEVCPYLSNEISCFEHRIILSMNAEVYEGMLSRGWRRFGYDFFRPACPSCLRCRSLRVCVDEFQPSKSHRRILQKNANLRLVIQSPTASEQHLKLFNEYHASMHEARGWAVRHVGRDEYMEAFVGGGAGFAREFLYYDGDRLVGLGLVDILPNSVSSIYFVHDPAYRKRALGIYSMLTELNFARERGLQFNYMGYWIPECQSMAYKSQYQPHDILIGFPEDDCVPAWTRGQLQNS